MAKKSWLEKAKRAPKFTTRLKHRCSLCGRPRGFLRKFGICRICFRTLSHRGQIPGVTKSSW